VGYKSKIYQKGCGIVTNLLFIICLLFVKNTSASNEKKVMDTPTVNNSVSNEDVMYLDYLMNVEVPDVISASKSVEKLDKAPSVITVWTDSDIKRMGIKSVAELLDKTVGFFNNRQFSGVTLSSRGLGADGNEAYLLLIDGHNVNSIVMKGMWSQYIFPFIYDIKQVEIMRGPGSTLWGSDAALGIIHIITKNGAEADGIKVTANVSSNENGDELQKTGNILIGGKFSDKSDIMLSITGSIADGFPEGGALSHAGDYAMDNYTNNSWIAFNGIRLQPFDKIKDSYEFYSKVRINDLTLILRAADMLTSNMWGDRTNKKDSTNYQRKRDYGFEFKYLLNFTDKLQLDTKFYSDLQTFQQRDQEPVMSIYKDIYFEDYSTEQSYGIENMLSYTFSDHITSKLGARYTQTYLSPILDIAYDTSSTTTDNSNKVNVKVLPEDRDRALGLYLETNLDYKYLNLGLGGRADYNNLREKGWVFLPRASVIGKPLDNLSVKYLFNTGCVRPPALIGFLGIIPTKFETKRKLYGADKSERIFTHDIVASYNSDKVNVSAGYYHTIMKNYFNYSGASWDYILETDPLTGITSRRYMISKDGQMPRNDTIPGGTMFIVNTGTITSDGIELEGKYKITNSLGISANYSLVIQCKLDDWKFINDNVPDDSLLQANFLNLKSIASAIFDNDKNMNAFPKHIWNVGLDWTIKDFLNINIHYRGFAGMVTKAASFIPGPYSDYNQPQFINGDTVKANLYVTLPSAHYIDVNVLFEPRISKLPITMNVYAKNLLNKNNKIAYLPHGGYWESQGIVVGGQLTFDFKPVISNAIKKE
jgi:outer membrane receptor protein involved in Fe transport